MDKKIQIYVVKEGETLKSIATKHSMAEQELIRLNQYCKIREIVIGEPLKVFAPDKNADLRYNEKLRSQLSDSLVKVKDNIVAETTNFFAPATGEKKLVKKELIEKIAFYTKEALLSSAFVEKNKRPAEEKADKAIKDLLKNLFGHDASPSKVAILEDDVIAIVHHVIELVTNIIKKNTNEIKNYKKDLNTFLTNFYNDYKKTFTKEISNEAKELIKEMLELTQTLIAKITTMKFEEAQLVFEEILERLDQLVSIKK